MSTQLREGTIRILTETLRLSKGGNRVQLEDIAWRARTSESLARRILTNAVSEPDDNWITLGPRLRIRLALEIARAGSLRDSAGILRWQEFEKFAEECLKEAGFQTKRNVRVRGDGRAWQIDVIGFRGELVLAMDCKHWNTPGYLSRFKHAAEHQRTATRHLLASLRKEADRVGKQRQALPFILTLSEPPVQFSDGVALVSVEKLPSFLSGVTPYDETLPFMASPSSLVENPMSSSE